MEGFLGVGGFAGALVGAVLLTLDLIDVALFLAGISLTGSFFTEEARGLATAFLPDVVDLAIILAFLAAEIVLAGADPLRV